MDRLLPDRATSRTSRTGRRTERPTTISRHMQPVSEEDLGIAAEEEEDAAENRGRVQVSTELELPFSAEVAFDAFSDLPRQPSWSPWLHSVSYIDDTMEETKWKLKYLGVTVSWNAINIRKERPNIIEWVSTKGLKNSGRVVFLAGSGQDPDSTLMKMTMSFHVPGPAARMFRKNKKIQSLVKDRMIAPTLILFRDIVVENDMKQITVVSAPLDKSTDCRKSSSQ